jgi:hypothetical protein
MKLIKTSIFILFAGLLFTACEVKVTKEVSPKTENTDGKPAPAATGPVSKLEGTWVVKTEDGDDKGTNVGTTYEFKGNRLTTAAHGMSLPGNVEISDSSFSFLMDASATKEKIVYNYNFDGETLVLKMADGPQVFHLVKK